ncbi:hypothetical protein [Nocardia abscessus]|uniref:hypothetical protein n=1 Tax=Nocardia abscessus TaxID=120957 RepID=UPI002455321D|nr:hypothetical protein [Nocardia abscessus]
MPEEIDGKIFYAPGEYPYDDDISDEELAKIKAGFEAFRARRDAVPEDQRIHLRDRFGDEDALGTDREAAYLAEVEERKKRGEYWG